MEGSSIYLAKVSNCDTFEERKALNLKEIIQFILFFGFIVSSFIIGAFSILIWVFSIF